MVVPVEMFAHMVRRAVFLCFEEPGIFGDPKIILQGSGTELFETETNQVPI